MWSPAESVPNYSLKNILASSCVFRFDLVVLICYAVHVPLNYVFFLVLAAAASASDGVRRSTNLGYSCDFCLSSELDISA